MSPGVSSSTVWSYETPANDPSGSPGSSIAEQTSGVHFSNFERATAVFDNGAPEPLQLVRNGKSTPVKVKPGMGYQHEIAYFVDCVRTGRRPEVVDPAGAARSVAIVEAEVRSIRSGRPEKV